MKSNHLSNNAKIEDYVSMAKHYLDLAAKTSTESGIAFSLNLGNKTIQHRPANKPMTLTVAKAMQLLRSNTSLDHNMRNKIAAVIGGAGDITYFETEVSRYAISTPSGWIVN